MYAVADRALKESAQTQSFHYERWAKTTIGMSMYVKKLKAFSMYSIVEWVGGVAQPLRDVYALQLTSLHAYSVVGWVGGVAESRRYWITA